MPFYSFGDYYYYLLEESSRKNESVINKISKLFLLKDADRVLSKFKEIFDIEDNTIKLQKVEVGGTYDPNINTVNYRNIFLQYLGLANKIQQKVSCLFNSGKKFINSFSFFINSLFSFSLLLSFPIRPPLFSYLIIIH